MGYWGCYWNAVRGNDTGMLGDAEGKVEKVLGGCWNWDAGGMLLSASGMLLALPAWRCLPGSQSRAEPPALPGLFAAPSLLPPPHSVPLTHLWLLALLVADPKTPQNPFPLVCFGAGRGQKGPLRGPQDTPQSSSLGRATDEEQGKKGPENCSDLQNQTQSVSMVITRGSSQRPWPFHCHPSATSALVCSNPQQQMATEAG